MTTIIVGGGVVGLSVAYGLLKKGEEVIVLDGADDDARASHGNFGLVWIQGKGVSAPHYASWSRRSAALWGAYAGGLFEEAGVDVSLSQTGGIKYFTKEDELSAYVSELSGLQSALG